jgi:ArsR family transcriptional regulator, arsenate/arsenite/antimonite-responsive transcriptional repressor
MRAASRMPSDIGIQTVSISVIPQAASLSRMVINLPGLTRTLLRILRTISCRAVLCQAAQTQAPAEPTGIKDAADANANALEAERYSAGRIAERIGLVPSSLTFHLQNLQRAGLISQRRESRRLIYSADFTAMTALVGYLTDDCCAESVAECCPPARQPKTAKRTVRAA